MNQIMGRTNIGSTCYNSAQSLWSSQKLSKKFKS